MEGAVIKKKSFAADLGLLGSLHMQVMDKHLVTLEVYTKREEQSMEDLHVAGEGMQDSFMVEKDENSTEYDDMIKGNPEADWRTASTEHFFVDVDAGDLF